MTPQRPPRGDYPPTFIWHTLTSSATCLPQHHIYGATRLNLPFIYSVCGHRIMSPSQPKTPGRMVCDKQNTMIDTAHSVRGATWETRLITISRARPLLLWPSPSSPYCEHVSLGPPTRSINDWQSSWARYLTHSRSKTTKNGSCGAGFVERDLCRFGPRCI